MTRRSKVPLKVLQRRCARALRLYIDLAEASCDLLCQSERGQLPPQDRLRLLRLSRDESAAMNSYRQARLDLIAALSENVSAADKEEVCRVISATT